MAYIAAGSILVFRALQHMQLHLIQGARYKTVKREGKDHK